MPREKYVEDRFYKGMKFEEFFEDLLRELNDVKVVKRTDVSSKPHKHEEIKYVPPTPNFMIYLKEITEPIIAWVTHKNMTRHQWYEKRRFYIADMYWRFKTRKFMEPHHYMVYGILEEGTPFEILWCKVGDTEFRGTWRRPNDPDQDDLRARINMSASRVIFKDGKTTIDKLSSVL